jgi:hypothetical protein
MLEDITSSKYFTGVLMILLNIGSKYVQIDLSKTQQDFFKSSIFRQLLIFTVAWSATKDIYASIVLTASFHILTNYLFNEKCKYCIIPKKYQSLEVILDANKDGEISKNEINTAVKILKKAKYQEQFRNFQR